jgi:hypothetical protein
MLIELIMDLLMFLADTLISLIPTIDVDIPENVFDSLMDFIPIVAYLLPIPALVPIMVTLIGLDIAIIVVTIVIRVKKFIPGVG